MTSRRRALTAVRRRRRNAALKAWETRRANELAEIRSAAARKAWRTRRANG